MYFWFIISRSRVQSRIFEIINFCFIVAICDLEHAVEAMYGLP